MAVVEVEKQLPRDLTDHEVGTTRVKNVRVDVQEDSDGDAVIRVALILSDPPGKAETWPVKDLWELRVVVHHAIEKLDPPLSWFVEFEPEHPGEYDDAGSTGQHE